ncbi:MAG: glycosyltransferase family 2 protein [Microcystaceae cyanobacterium]
MTSPLVSIIIPVLNDVEGLRQCLKALQCQTLSSEQYEIIVVDNGSSEAIKQCVAEFEQTRYLTQEIPGSYASRNVGIEAAKGSILAFTDADCLPVSIWLEKGIECLKNTPNAGLVAGNIELFPLDPQKPNGVELFSMITDLCQEKYIERLNFGATANVFTYRKVFDEVGLFKTTLKSGGDMEWGKRVHKAGYKTVYCAEAAIRHPTRSTWKSIKAKTLRVIGGVHDMYPPYSARALVNNIRKDWPKGEDIKNIIQDPRIKSNPDRLKVLMVVLGVKWLRSSEQVRLFFGGKSQNL